MLNSLITLLNYTAANGIPTSTLLHLREEVTNTCINILQSYRKYCASVSSSGQLILPEALKLLPLYTLGMVFLTKFAIVLFHLLLLTPLIILLPISALIKSIGLRNEGRLDDRSYWISLVSSVSVLLAVPLVFPRLIPIHDLTSRVQSILNFDLC